MDWKTGYNIYAKNLLIFDPSKLNSDEIKNEMIDNDFHVYLICTRKKLVYHSTHHFDNNMSATNYYYLDNNDNKVFDLKWYQNDFTINNYIKSERTIEITNRNGELERHKDYTFFNSIFFDNDVLRAEMNKELNNTPISTDLKVEYIGQAYGSNGNRKINKRLTNHEKLLEIVLNIISKTTHEEVYVLGVSIKVSDSNTLLIKKDTKIDRDIVSVEGLKRLQARSSKRIDEGQELTLFEASLINYFQPEYNKEYKKNFPSDGYSSYDEIYSTEFNYSSMELNLEDLKIRLYTDTIKERRYNHNNKIILSNNAEKKSFFDFLFDS